MSPVRIRCAGCGTVFSVADMRGRPKWCSERCRRQTLYGGRCVDCGAVTSGSDGPGRAAKWCAQCQLTRLHERQSARVSARRAQIEGLWAAGLTGHEINERLGLGWARPSNVIVKMRGRGYDLPYRYSSERVARMTDGSGERMARARAARRVGRRG